VLVDLQQLLEVLPHLVTLPPLFPQRVAAQVQTMVELEVMALQEVEVVEQIRTSPKLEEPEIHRLYPPHKVTTVAMVATTKVVEAAERHSRGKIVAHCNSVKAE